MKNFSVKEIEPLVRIVDNETLNNLELFLINTNLSTEDRTKLVDIIRDSVLISSGFVKSNYQGCTSFVKYKR